MGTSNGKMPKMKEHKPRFHVSVSKLPVAKDWKVGEKYKLMLEVRQVMRMQDELMDEDTVGFEILSIKPVTKTE